MNRIRQDLVGLSIKEKRKVWFKDFMKKNPNYKTEWRNKQKPKLREIIDSFLDKGCSTCQEKDKRCLDFHHKEPKDKEFKISNAIGKCVSISKLMNEINKCMVLCANCHRKATKCMRKY